MITFFYDIIKFLVGVRHGIKNDVEFRVLFFFLVTLLAGATFFYYRVEGWSVIDSLYFSVMTMSTIGYGDFVPTTTLSKSFTIIFALLSIGVFAALMSKKNVKIILYLKKLKKAKHTSTMEKYLARVMKKAEL